MHFLCSLNPHVNGLIIFFAIAFFGFIKSIMPETTSRHSGNVERIHISATVDHFNPAKSAYVRLAAFA